MSKCRRDHKASFPSHSNEPQQQNEAGNQRPRPQPQICGSYKHIAKVMPRLLPSRRRVARRLTITRVWRGAARRCNMASLI